MLRPTVLAAAILLLSPALLQAGLIVSDSAAPRVESNVCCDVILAAYAEVNGDQPGVPQLHCDFENGLAAFGAQSQLNHQNTQAGSGLFAASKTRPPLRWRVTIGNSLQPPSPLLDALLKPV